MVRQVLSSSLGAVCLGIGSIAWAGAAALDIDRSFAADFCPPTVPFQEGTAAVGLDTGWLEQAQVTGSAQVDSAGEPGGPNVLELQPAADGKRVQVQWQVPVESGRFYRFAAAYRSTPRTSGDSSTLGMYGFINMRWLDAAGAGIPGRDKLMARPGAETTWGLREVVALAPPGAVQATLGLVAGWHEPDADLRGCFRDLEWGAVHVAPIRMDLSPRVLRSSREAFTIRISRTHTSSVSADGRLTVRVRDDAGKTFVEWQSPLLITLPWSETVRLPETAGEGWTVSVTIEPMRAYPGHRPWRIEEPILIADSRLEGRLRDGRFVLGGRKRILLGAYHAKPDDYAPLKAAGFNTVITKHYDAAEARIAYDQLHAMGLYGFASVGGGGQTRANQPRLRQVIETLSDHPALLAWSLMDEPTRKGIGPREIAWYGTWVQSLAPAVPTTVNCCGPYQFDRFASTSDIFSMDPYPLYFWQGLRRDGDPPADLADVTRWLTTARRHLPPGRAQLAVIECFTFDRAQHRPSDGLELRNMIWQALVNGAAGVMIYSIRDAGWYLLEEPQFDDLARIFEQINDLGPWLLSTPLPQDPDAVWTARPGRLVSRTWEHDGRRLTVLVNLDREPLDVTRAGDRVTLDPLEARIIMDPPADRSP